jgi:hypothetical protein
MHLKYDQIFYDLNLLLGNIFYSLAPGIRYF